MRLWLLILLLLPFATAFEESLPVSPPPLPGEEGEQVPLALIAVDTKEQITDSHVLVELSGPEDRNTLTYIDDSGDFALEAAPGNWWLVLKIDDVATPGKDYYYQGSFSPGKQSKINAFPTGSATGSIRQDGAVVPGAEVRVKCSGSYGDEVTLKSDATGRFTFDWLPVGKCRISSAKGELAGFGELTIVQGELTETTIQLDTKVSGSRSLLWVVLLVLAIFIMTLLLRRAKQAPKQETLVPTRTEDIVQTLPKKEQEVVNFLMSDNGAYQNRVLRATKIPKTTLLRLVDSLERKKILTVEKEGKIKRLRLTDWFLGK